MRTVRDHDQLYLSEDRKLNPKEYFKFIGATIKPFLCDIQNPKIIDVGCATGDFLHYLSTQHPSASFTGLDIMPELLDRARKEIPTAHFQQGDITEESTLPKAQYDAAFLIGVHSIFDDHEPFLDHMMKLLRPDGRAYIFGIFNPMDCDVLVKVRASGEQGSWQAGWNVFSKKTISTHLNKKNVRHRFVDWSIGIDIPKNPTDPLRSWTFKMADGSRGIVNGTQILHQFSLLEMDNRR